MTSLSVAGKDASQGECRFSLESTAFDFTVLKQREAEWRHQYFSSRFGVQFGEGTAVECRVP